MSNAEKQSLKAQVRLLKKMVASDLRKLDSIKKHVNICKICPF